jgi:hypothetical protein
VAASIAAPAMATTPARELTVTSATDSGYRTGSPYVRDSSEKDHAMASRAGSDGAVRPGEGGDRDASQAQSQGTRDPPRTFLTGSEGAVRLEEGVIGMLRKLSRKARGVHHGPF